MVIEAVQLVVVELGPAMEYFLSPCFLEYVEVYHQKLSNFPSTA